MDWIVNIVLGVIGGIISGFLNILITHFLGE